MRDSVPNWESIVHKNVRSSDNENAGNVIEIEDDTITVVHGTRVEFVIPKDNVEGFDGAEVRLDLPYKDLGKYLKRT